MRLGGVAGGLDAGLDSFIANSTNMINAKTNEEQAAHRMGIEDKNLALNMARGTREQTSFDMAQKDHERESKLSNVDEDLEKSGMLPTVRPIFKTVASQMGVIDENGMIRAKDKREVTKTIMTNPQTIKEISNATVNHWGQQVKDLDKQIAAGTSEGIDIKDLILKKADAEKNYKQANYNNESFLKEQSLNLKEAELARKAEADQMKNEIGLMKVQLAKEKGAGGGDKLDRFDKLNELGMKRIDQYNKQWDERILQATKQYDKDLETKGEEYATTNWNSTVKGLAGHFRPRIAQVEKTIGMEAPEVTAAPQLGGRSAAGGAPDMTGNTPAATSKGGYDNLYKIALNAGSASKAVQALGKMGYNEKQAKEIIQKGIQEGVLK